MIGIDTNLLVYAHRRDSPHHAAAARALTRAIGSQGGCAIPWPCLHEFLAVVTHPKIYSPPTQPNAAVATLQALLAQPRVTVIGEGPEHLDVLSSLLRSGHVTGPRIHDARIAAICLAHGVNPLLSADRDFHWFPALTVRNPLADEQAD